MNKDWFLIRRDGTIRTSVTMRSTLAIYDVVLGNRIFHLNRDGNLVFDNSLLLVFGNQDSMSLYFTLPILPLLLVSFLVGQNLYIQRKDRYHIYS